MPAHPTESPAIRPPFDRASSAPEHQHVEWKETWRDDDLKWIAGFANAQGGVLVLGRNGAGEVVGLPDAKRLLVDLPNKVRDVLGIVVAVDLLASALFLAGKIESWGRGIALTAGEILRLLEAEPSMTLAEVAAKIGKTVRAVELASAKLAKEGRLRHVGPQKGGHWELLK